MNVSTTDWTGEAVSVVRPSSLARFGPYSYVRLNVRSANGIDLTWYWDLRTPYLELRPRFE